MYLKVFSSMLSLDCILRHVFLCVQMVFFYVNQFLSFVQHFRGSCNNAYVEYFAQYGGDTYVFFF